MDKEWPPSYLKYLESVKREKIRRQAYNKIYRKETYEKRKELGICTRCGKELAEKGHVLCMGCLLYSNQSRSGYSGRSPKRFGRRK